MEITTSHLMKTIRKKLPNILIFALLCGIATFAVSKYFVPKTYVSTVKFYVSTPASSNNNNDYSDINELNYAQKVVSTYIEMLQTDSFLGKVQENSGAQMGFDDFKKTIKFDTLNNTEIFKADVSADSAQEAKKVADTISKLAPDIISGFKAGASLKIVDPANMPDKPSSPNVTLNTIIGFLLGFFISMCYFVMCDRFDIRIKSEEDITEYYNLPVLASIPAFTKKFAKEKRKKV
ncbi:MAG TPA: hypothetical protein DC024_06950 [Clostridiales bacterium]|nr:hypothetical protein [Clostridiales bacterium]